MCYGVAHRRVAGFQETTELSFRRQVVSRARSGYVVVEAVHDPFEYVISLAHYETQLRTAFDTAE